MGQKILVGNPVTKGFVNNRTAFGIDNDAFPVITNAYQWRGRVKRKRGTSLLNRLKRYFNSTNVSYFPSPGTAAVSAGGAVNILTGFSLQTNGNIVPGSVTIRDTTTTQVYTDPAMDGILSGSLGGSGTINYATGAVVILPSANNAVTAIFNYYPDLPVMGLEELRLIPEDFPGTLGFDTRYSYNILPTAPYNIYSVSFYKNPVAAAPYNYPGYVRKTNTTPTSWNGQDYQQFWTVNYEGALWATNGITVPFTKTNIGMQYKPIITVTVTAGGPPAIVDLQITAHGLVVGDFLFINEVVTTTGINYQTGYVTAVIDANNVTVEFPNATIATNGTGGIAQYLTNRSDITKDGIRWYDGDPTDGNSTNPTLSASNGWVNFAPPLSNLAFSIDDSPAAQYYLVGARLIVPFKDRLLFFGPVIQTSVANSQIYLQDTVIYSQNGNPYYTASFTGPVTSATTVFNPILTPVNQLASPNSYFEDLTGFGGFITEGSQQPITTVSTNEDVLMVGFSGKETRFVYTGNDIIPFNFFTVNSEYGSNSTFSSINLDRGALKVGDRGIIISSQVASQRIDLAIPDQVFQFNLTNNGTQRVTAQRDFINEWVYFTYPDNEVEWKFPNQTLQYNYRDDSWGVFNETYTTYGQFQKVTGYTWATIGERYPTWSVWNDPWNAGSATLLQPEVIAGNQQGFVVFREDGTDESNSLYIQSISSSTVTSPDHSLNNGDFIVITGVIGTMGAQVNDKIFEVANATTNTFTLNPVIGSGTYFGGGLIKRMYVPFIQTKQFPVAWEFARKTRIGAQQYLLSTTKRGQIELQIYLSQNASSAFNRSPFIYSDIVYTCPESTNLGLTPSNTNLQMIADVEDGTTEQDQIWHRMNTSLIGDTVQLGFTMSGDQMRSLLPIGEAFEITGITQAYPCVLTCAAGFSPHTLIRIEGVVGMGELNGNDYSVISSSPTTVTINVDSTTFAAYTGFGTATALQLPNQFSEIELHAFVIDVTPSSVLA